MKPSDFFLGVVNFFGVLVPGAVFLLLRGCYVDCWVFPNYPVPPWLVFGGAAYVAGQLLLASTELLNPVADWLAKNATTQLGPDIDTFLTEACKRLPLLNLKTASQTQFHTALSFIRLQNGAAAGEIDAHMANYKLLRNLLAVFAIDWVCRVFSTPAEKCLIMLGEGVLFILCLVAFVRMLGWAKLLAYQYVCLIVDGCCMKNAMSTPTSPKITMN